VPDAAEQALRAVELVPHTAALGPRTVEAAPHTVDTPVGLLPDTRATANTDKTPARRRSPCGLALFAMEQRVAGAWRVCGVGATDGLRS